MKPKKTALLHSVIALLLCVSMLVGTTFAWFTDEVKSGVNKITAGNLDVDVVTADGKSIQDKATLFDEIERWEPGVVAYENLTVVNLGNLALKYQMKVNFDNASPAKNGKTLADALNVAIVPGGVDASLSREELIASLDGKWQDLVSFTQSGKLDSDKNLLADAETSDTYGVVIYWKPTAEDNDFNMNNADQGTVLTIDLGIDLFATQLDAEEDSFGDDYDVNAPTLITVNGTFYDTFEEAAAALAAASGNVAIMMNNVEHAAASGHGLVIPENVNAALDVRGYVSLTGAAGGAGIWVSEGASLTVTGDTLIAKGNAGVDDNQGGSGIGGPGNITIDGVKALTAEGYGKHAYGIGGTNTTVVIKNAGSVSAKGGYVADLGMDYQKNDQWLKKVPEGGPAIGGIHVTIEASTIKSAIGGGKAAGIGSQFWQATNIVIKDSTILKAVGGASGAGIGGGRANNDNTIDITVKIDNSTVSAQGGLFAAGIGTGYSSDLTRYTGVDIQITGNSKIAAVGGVNGAGIGTGYHVGRLTGSIDGSVDLVGTKAGQTVQLDLAWGFTNTVAQDIGYGSVHMDRGEWNNADGTQEQVTFTVAGVVIDEPAYVKTVSSDEELKAALTADRQYIVVDLTANVTYQVSSWNTYAMGTAKTRSITINGNGNTITFDLRDSDWSHVTTNGARLILNDLNIQSSGYNSGHWKRNGVAFGCELEMNQVTSCPIILENNAKLTNTTLNCTGSVYALWIYAEDIDVAIDGLTVNGGRGIKIADEDADVAKVDLSIKNADFNTEEKAAILVTSTAGAEIHLSNVDIQDVKADNVNEVWVDEDRSAYSSKVKVVGGSKFVEGTKIFEVATVAALRDLLTNNTDAGSGDNMIRLTEDLDMTGVDWKPVKVAGYTGAGVITLDGAGHTIKNLNAPLFAGGFAGNSGIVIKNLTIADSQIVSANTIGSGAFIESVDSMQSITLDNCHLKNSTVTGGNGSRTGGLIGWTAGYNNVNDGPVKTYVTITNCSVIGCTITCNGSVGGIYGHAGNNAWTYSVVENCTVMDCNLNSTKTSDWRVGVVVGTANVGELTIANITESGNTMTQTGLTAPAGQSNLYGRFVPVDTGKLFIDGVEIQ